MAFLVYPPKSVSLSRQGNFVFSRIIPQSSQYAVFTLFLSSHIFCMEDIFVCDNIYCTNFMRRFDNDGWFVWFEN